MLPYPLSSSSSAATQDLTVVASNRAQPRRPASAAPSLTPSFTRSVGAVAPVPAVPLRPFLSASAIAPQPDTLSTRALNQVILHGNDDDICDALEYSAPAGGILERGFRNHVLRTIASRTDARTNECLKAAYRAFQDADHGISVMPLNEAIATGDRALAKAAIVVDPESVTHEQFSAMVRYAPELAALATAGKPELARSLCWLEFHHVLIAPIIQRAVRQADAKACSADIVDVVRAFPHRACRIADRSHDKGVWQAAFEVAPRPFRPGFMATASVRYPDLVSSFLTKEPEAIDSELLRALVSTQNNTLLEQACALNPGAINAVDAFGSTVAHQAARIANVSTYAILKSHGADMQARDIVGRTPEAIISAALAVSPPGGLTDDLSRIMF